MPHVVTEKCAKCKYTDCLSVCPVVCFHEAPEFLVIDPDECIDCGMCVDACPAGAIYAADAVPAGLACAVKLNARLAQVLPLVLEPREPLPDADEWNGVEGKWRLVDERWLG